MIRAKVEERVRATDKLALINANANANAANPAQVTTGMRSGGEQVAVARYSRRSLVAMAAGGLLLSGWRRSAVVQALAAGDVSGQPAPRGGVAIKPVPEAGDGITYSQARSGCSRRESPKAASEKGAARRGQVRQQAEQQVQSPRQVTAQARCWQEGQGQDRPVEVALPAAVFRSACSSTGSANRRPDRRP